MLDPKSPAGVVESYLEDKQIVELGTRGRMYCVLHRDKVRSEMFEERCLRSCEAQSRDIEFGTLTVQLHSSRTDDEFVRIGVLDVRHYCSEDDTRALAQWIILHRVAALTGFFCNPYMGQFPHPQFSERDPLTRLAVLTNAIGSAPWYQLVEMDPGQNGLLFAHPSVFLFFGYDTQIKVPELEPNINDAGIDLGIDVCSDMVEERQIPVWPRNDMGSAYVPHLRHIKMQQVDWARWFNGCFQTWVRVGKPSTRS